MSHDTDRPGNDGPGSAAGMNAICEDLKLNVAEVIETWDRLVREQPWYSLPPEHRIDSLPDVALGLVEAALCSPTDEEAHRRAVLAAAEHGRHRREQGIPEHLILTEYHLLRQAIWYYLTERFGPSRPTTEAIMHIDTALSLATNASMWGYHRVEIEAVGKWEEGMNRLVRSSPLLRR